MNIPLTGHYDAYDIPFGYRCQCFVSLAISICDGIALALLPNSKSNTTMIPRIPVFKLKTYCHLKPIEWGIHGIWHRQFTCVEMRKARNASNIWLLTPFSGPIHTTRYVIPNNGISTSNAFDAFLYCRVSAVFADRNFIMSTLTIHF